MVRKMIVLFFCLMAVTTAFAEEKRYPIPIDGSPQKGPKDAPVTIVEFIDFQ